MQYNATVFCIGVNRFFTGNALERERERERQTDRERNHVPNLSVRRNWQ